MELILIRHGLPEKVVRADGGAADPNLSEQGHRQAAQVAQYLKDEAIHRLYSRPMRRAFQTAEPISKILDLAIEQRDGVAEYDQDANEYIPVEQLKKENYEAWLRLMKGDMVGVDFEAFTNRVVETLEVIVQENRGKTVAVTCHGGVVNIWAAHVLGMPLKMFFNPYYTSVSRFRAASTGEKSVITLNERFHVRDEL
jgi:probable phosphoglycerate mutase